LERSHDIKQRSNPTFSAVNVLESTLHVDIVVHNRYWLSQDHTPIVKSHSEPRWSKNAQSYEWQQLETEVGLEV
jgi:hypothetical protein